MRINILFFRTWSELCKIRVIYKSYSTILLLQKRTRKSMQQQKPLQSSAFMEGLVGEAMIRFDG